MFKKLSSIIAIFLFALPSLGLTFAESVAKTNQASIHASIGGAKGGFGFRGAYEYSYHRTFSIGGFMHLEPKSSENSLEAPAITAIHAFVRPHFYQRTWDLYVSPGFGISMADTGDVDETIIGPSLSFGVLYQLNENTALGLENLKVYSWTGDDFKGILTDTLFANIKISF